MSTSRRAVLAGLAAGAAAAPAVARGAVEASPDPAIALIDEFRRANAEFSRLGPDEDAEEAAIAATWGPVFDRLHRPPKPTTVNGAIAYIECAVEESLVEEPALSLVKAAAAFLRASAGRVA